MASNATQAAETVAERAWDALSRARVLLFACAEQPARAELLTALDEARRLVAELTGDAGPGSSSDEAKALLQLTALFEAYPSATGLSHLMGLVLRDAVRWRAFTGSARIRVLGSARLGQPDAHLGLELWGEYPDAGPQDYGREQLTAYADGIRSAHGAEAAHAR